MLSWDPQFSKPDGTTLLGSSMSAGLSHFDLCF